MENENNSQQECSKDNSPDAQTDCSSASCTGDCCSTGPGPEKTDWKIAIFLVVVIAAGVVTARSFMRNSDSETEQTPQLYATIQPEQFSENVSPAGNATDIEKPAQDLWGPQLDSLASLNQVAANIDAVFVLLAAENQEGSQSVIEQIEAAAKKIQANGTRISAFTLKKEAPNYARLAQQRPLPCVLAMVKGGGMGVAAGNITEANILQAFVAASSSRSGCGPAGCGSGGACPPAPGPIRKGSK